MASPGAREKPLGCKSNTCHEEQPPFYLSRQDSYLRPVCPLCPWPLNPLACLSQTVVCRPQLDLRCFGEGLLQSSSQVNHMYAKQILPVFCLIIANTPSKSVYNYRIDCAGHSDEQKLLLFIDGGRLPLNFVHCTFLPRGSKHFVNASFNSTPLEPGTSHLYQLLLRFRVRGGSGSAKMASVTPPSLASHRLLQRLPTRGGISLLTS